MKSQHIKQLKGECFFCIVGVGCGFVCPSLYRRYKEKMLPTLSIRLKNKSDLNESVGQGQANGRTDKDKRYRWDRKGG